MAKVTVISEPHYNLELSQVELRVLAALVGNTSANMLREALERDYEPKELQAVDHLWDVLVLDFPSAKE